MMAKCFFLLLSIFPNAVTRALAEEPSQKLSVELVRTLSRGHSTHIALACTGVTAECSLEFTTRSKGQDLKTNKSISKTSAEALRSLLMQGNHAFAEWKTDLSCGTKNQWSLRVQSERKVICKDGIAIQKLQDFLAGVVSESF